MQLKQQLLDFLDKALLLNNLEVSLGKLKLRLQPQEDFLVQLLLQQVEDYLAKLKHRNPLLVAYLDRHNKLLLVLPNQLEDSLELPYQTLRNQLLVVYLGKLRQLQVVVSLVNHRQPNNQVPCLVKLVQLLDKLVYLIKQLP